jgi:hypothetical protein
MLIGFLFWVPLLVRMTGVFAFSVLQAALNGGDTTSLKQPLEFAMRFYIMGFQMIFQTLFDDAGTETSRMPLSACPNNW